MGKVVSYRRENKPLPGELLLMYRQRSGLTQNQLAAYLGLKSDRMVQKWEGGYTLPTAPRLQSLIQLYLQKRVFVQGEEAKEAQELWQTVKNMFDLTTATYETYPIFDMGWFKQLLAPGPVALSQSDTAREAIAPTSELAVLEKVTIRSRLPLPLNQLIGREDELRKIQELLKPGEEVTQMLTLTGPGGTGKTRLALQIARELHASAAFKDGVCLIELAPLSEAAFVPHLIAGVLGLREEGKAPVTNIVVNYLRDKNLLLVLDNCEHLALACAELAQTLLQNCPQLKLLATSREGLNIPGEFLFVVPPLQVPFPVDPNTDYSAPDFRPDPENDLDFMLKLAACESIQLFIQKARTVQTDFALTPKNALSIAQICQRLDGLPLAIELAAVRVQVFSVEQIRTWLTGHLEDRFRLLASASRTALPHQQTLKATLEWSYNLLSKAEQTLLNRLAVFEGSWILEEAEAICYNLDNSERLSKSEIMDLLAQLVKKSLVQVEGELNWAAQKAYRLLETIKQYAYEKLVQTGEAEIFQLKHCEYYLALTEQTDTALSGPAWEGWYSRLRYSYANLRRALSWSLEDGEEAPTGTVTAPVDPLLRLELGARLSVALGPFWYSQGLYKQGGHWLAIWLSRVEVLPGREWDALRANSLRFIGYLHFMQSEYEPAWSPLEKALALFQALNDRLGMAKTLLNLGMVAGGQGRMNRAVEYYEASVQLYRETGSNNDFNFSQILINYGAQLCSLGKLGQAQAVLEESLAMARKSSFQSAIAMALGRLGEVARERLDFEQAISLYNESLVIYRKLNESWGIPFALSRLGEIAYLQGQYEQALVYLKESLAHFDKYSNRWGKAELLRRVGDVLMAQAKSAEAFWYYQQGLALFEELGNLPEIANCLVGLAEYYATLDRPQQATIILGAAAILYQQTNFPVSGWEKSRFERWVATCRGRLEEADFTTLWSKGQMLSRGLLETGIGNDNWSSRLIKAKEKEAQPD